MMRLKVTKNQGFHPLSRRCTFGKPQGRQGGVKLTPPSLLRIKKVMVRPFSQKKKLSPNSKAKFFHKSRQQHADITLYLSHLWDCLLLVVGCVEIKLKSQSRFKALYFVRRDAWKRSGKGPMNNGFRTRNATTESFKWNGQKPCWNLLVIPSEDSCFKALYWRSNDRCLL